MGIDAKAKNEVLQFIVSHLRDKFTNYKPGVEVMPFHYRLLGKDRMALFSFIHSINTSFGSSIFEQVAVMLATPNFKKALRSQHAYNKINVESQTTIQSIINKLSLTKDLPNKQQELEALKQSISQHNLHQIRTPKVDIWLEAFDGHLYMIDLKTVKPNIGEFISYKRNLLEWVAVELIRDSDRLIDSLIAMPYNPYEPSPYKSWQLRGMLDLKKELLVGKEFWDFIGGINTYEDLLDCFEDAGTTLRPEIDEYFSRFQEKHG